MTHHPALDLTQYKTPAQCADRIYAIDLDIAKMTQQVENAQSGEYDRSWMSRLKFAMKMRRTERERLLHHLGQLNRVAKQDSASRFERAFMDVAFNKLDATVYDSIMAEATAVFEKGGE